MYEELVKGLREHAERFDYDGWTDTAIWFEKAADAIEELNGLLNQAGQAIANLAAEIAVNIPIPIYEVECPECKSKIKYKKSEVYACHITCPVCGLSVWADTITPVRMEEQT